MPTVYAWQTKTLAMVLVFLICFALPLEFSLTYAATNANSAPATQWQQKYSNSAESVSRIIQTSDGGYAFIDIGWSHQTTMLPSTIYKVDSQGNVSWSKSLSNWRARDLAETNDHGLETFGVWSTYGTTYKYTPVVVKFDSSGKIQWTENQTNLASFSNIILTMDGGIAQLTSVGSLTGSYSPISEAIVTKLDSRGKIEWNNTFAEPANCSVAENIIQTSDGGYALIGSTSFNGEKDTPNLYYWVVKIDSNGNLEWSREFGSGPEKVDTNQTQNAGALNHLNRRTFGDNEGSYILETSDGGFVVGGVMYPVRDYSWWGFSYSTNPDMVQTVLIKINLDGETEWTKTYSGLETSPIIQTSDGGLAFGVYGAIIKTDSKGEVQWQKEVTYKDRYGSMQFKLEIVSLIETSDGAVAAIGSGYGTANYYQSSIYLIKTEPCLPQPTKGPPLPAPIQTVNGELFTSPITIIIAIIVGIIGCVLIVTFLLKKHRANKKGNHASL